MIRRQFQWMAAGVLPLFVACGDSSGPGIAVSLSLRSVDGVVVPTQLRTAGGQLITLADGKLQGTNWGHACGVALRLSEGPLTAAEVPDCKLNPGEAKTVSITLTDARFPAGTHEYRFIP